MLDRGETENIKERSYFGNAYRSVQGPVRTITARMERAGRTISPDGTVADDPNFGDAVSFWN